MSHSGSQNTPELIASDPKLLEFYRRNNVYIYINDKLSFGKLKSLSVRYSLTRFEGFRSGENVNWGNLCSCMSTVITALPGYDSFFRPRSDSTDTPGNAWVLELSKVDYFVRAPTLPLELLTSCEEKACVRK